jgi:GNAT superfamily N-acetyltransferase
MDVEVTTYYLEMRTPDELNPKTTIPDGLEIRKIGVPSPEFSRFLYVTVGRDWLWIDRLDWPAKKWKRWVDRDELDTWVAYMKGAPAGYFELVVQKDKSVELAFFGLLPQFIGKGLGGYLLSEAIRKAWDRDASRVWVHTCTLDHRHALGNYEARGLAIVREETHIQDIADA